MKRILRYGALVLALTLVALLGFVQLRWDRTFEAPYPQLEASTDPEIIERGRYLAYGPAHCASCHVSPEQREHYLAGEEPPLSGGSPFALPVGTWYPANLTPDPETGIGRRTDAEIARALRYNVRHDGRALLPAMEFQDLSDEDIVALLSFLRSQPSVRRAVPERELNLLGRTIAATGLRPQGPRLPLSASAPSGATVERGAYLANEVVSCDGCHTQRSLVTGEYTGAPFAGGTVYPDETGAGHQFVSPNLTPDPKTGRIAHWSEEQFIARFRAGRIYPGSPMAWEAFQRMTDEDLRAIYRYLRTLPPVENETGPSRVTNE